MRSFGLYAYRFSFFVLVLSVAVVVFSYCFRALKMSNHHLRLISGSTIFQQSSSWSFRYPSSDAAVIQFSLFKLCLNFSLHGCKRFMVTRMEFHFGWVYTLSVQSDSLRNRCTPTSKTGFDPAVPCATVWIILQTPFFGCVACYLFHMAFSFAVLLW